MVSMSMSSSLSPLLEKCKPHLGPSAFQDQTLILAGLAFICTAANLLSLSLSHTENTEMFCDSFSRSFYHPS